MKKLEALIKPFELIELKEALARLGIDEMLASDVRLYAGKSVRQEFYRGAEVNIDFVATVKLELLVEEEQVAAALTTIMACSPTAQISQSHILFCSELAPLAEALDRHDSFRLRIAS